MEFNENNVNSQTGELILSYSLLYRVSEKVRSPKNGIIGVKNHMVTRIGVRNHMVRNIGYGT